jgi:hypothetical protein
MWVRLTGETHRVLHAQGNPQRKNEDSVAIEPLITQYSSFKKEREL